MIENAKAIGWLNSGIFPVTTLFTCGYNHEEVIKKLKQAKRRTSKHNPKIVQEWIDVVSFEDCEEMYSDGRDFCQKVKTVNNKTGRDVDYFLIVLTESFNSTREDWLILTHEITHLCQFVLPEFLDRDKEHEAEAYHHNHIMSQCLDLLELYK
ncbi:MAG: hypothetical protein KAS32_26755 [Candidatus Peribacteraceae bacterium]|nr:hypothetical protein [Candidatus Peribacteraceae bacterium]